MKNVELTIYSVNELDEHYDIELRQTRQKLVIGFHTIFFLHVVKPHTLFQGLRA